MTVDKYSPWMSLVVIIKGSPCFRRLSKEPPVPALCGEILLFLMKSPLSSFSLFFHCI